MGIKRMECWFDHPFSFNSGIISDLAAIRSRISLNWKENLFRRHARSLVSVSAREHQELHRFGVAGMAGSPSITHITGVEVWESGGRSLSVSHVSLAHVSVSQ